MATATARTSTPTATPSDDRTKAQPESAPTKLDQIQAKVKENTRTAGQHIARRLHDLEKTNAKHVARAKREIKADLGKVKKATRTLGAKLKAKN